MTSDTPDIGPHARVLMVLPNRSDEGHPVLKQQGSGVDISYEYENEETAIIHWESISFEDVEIVEITASMSCSVEQIHAYDKIVELTQSPLLYRGKAELDKYSSDRRHFRVFLGGSYCYDIIAADLSVSWDAE